jgi:hypothetical protein
MKIVNKKRGKDAAGEEVRAILARTNEDETYGHLPVPFRYILRY